MTWNRLLYNMRFYFFPDSPVVGAHLWVEFFRTGCFLENQVFALYLRSTSIQWQSALRIISHGYMQDVSTGFLKPFIDASSPSNYDLFMILYVNARLRLVILDTIISIKSQTLKPFACGGLSILWLESPHAAGETWYLEYTIDASRRKIFKTHRLVAARLSHIGCRSARSFPKTQL